MSCNDLDDASLLARFEALQVAPRDFGHREHVRLAFAMLAATGDFGEAAVRYRRALRAFAAHVGAAGKYHETLTWAYLAVVHERMYQLFHERGLAPHDHERGLAPPDHERGLATPDHERGLAPPDHERGLAPPDHERGLATPDHERGLAPPDHERELVPPEPAETDAAPPGAHVCALSSFDLLARFPELLDHRAGALARYYDIAAVTRSDTARAVFVLPERA